MRFVEGGLLASLPAGRRGRTTNSPPQFGHLPPRTVSVQDAQNVHSNEQMRASADSGGRSLSQHSQLGLSSSILFSRWLGWLIRDGKRESDESIEVGRHLRRTSRQ